MKKLYIKLASIALVIILVSGYMIGVNLNKRIDKVDEIEAAVPEMQIEEPKDEEAIIGKININTATKDELMKLEGIGEILADRIIERRETVGLYTSEDQLIEVEGLGEGKFRDVEDFVTVE